MKTFPTWIYPTEIKRSMKLYPNLGEPEIRKECEVFYEEVVEGGTISPQSSRYDTYLRGWLMRANLEAE